MPVASVNTYKQKNHYIHNPNFEVWVLLGIIKYTTKPPCVKLNPWPHACSFGVGYLYLPFVPERTEVTPDIFVSK
jgi:hypothetical protein